MLMSSATSHARHMWTLICRGPSRCHHVWRLSQGAPSHGGHCAGTWERRQGQAACACVRGDVTAQWPRSSWAHIIQGLGRTCCRQARRHGMPYSCVQLRVTAAGPGAQAATVRQCNFGFGGLGRHTAGGTNAYDTQGGAGFRVAAHSYHAYAWAGGIGRLSSSSEEVLLDVSLSQPGDAMTKGDQVGLRWGSPSGRTSAPAAGLTVAGVRNILFCPRVVAWRCAGVKCGRNAIMRPGMAMKRSHVGMAKDGYTQLRRAAEPLSNSNFASASSPVGTHG
ncbi:hypothetical protein C8Q73DRAFT_301295 [Cubamyces lactineus]|nr:hypothetical protein C8Q73DRAFT_301295 [Cubamyces lactineus]